MDAQVVLLKELEPFYSCWVPYFILFLIEEVVNTWIIFFSFEFTIDGWFKRRNVSNPDCPVDRSAF